MISKIFKSSLFALFLVFGAVSFASAEMKCAPGKCGGQMMKEEPKEMKCGGAGKCDMKPQQKCKVKDCKHKDGKCDPKMKQKNCPDGKCPVQEPAKK